MYLHEIEVKLKRKYVNTNTLKHITCSEDAVNYSFDAFYNDCENHREHMFVVFLNRNNKVIGHKVTSSGSSTGCVIDIKEILIIALNLKAEGIMLFHNHPSGNVNPSNDDIEMTRLIKEGCRSVDLCLLDHIIVSHSFDNNFYSFLNEGVL